jgi:hypothetical protein
MRLMKDAGLAFCGMLFGLFCGMLVKELPPGACDQQVAEVMHAKEDQIATALKSLQEEGFCVGAGCIEASTRLNLDFLLWREMGIPPDLTLCARFDEQGDGVDGALCMSGFGNWYVFPPESMPPVKKWRPGGRRAFPTYIPGKPPCGRYQAVGEYFTNAEGSHGSLETEPPTRSRTFDQGTPR